jgi:hypothetical protein
LTYECNLCPILTSPILFPPESHFPGFEIPKHTQKITMNSILERERERRRQKRWVVAGRSDVIVQYSHCRVSRARCCAKQWVNFQRTRFPFSCQKNFVKSDASMTDNFLVVWFSVYLATSITYLSAVDVALKAMEFQLQAIKERLLEETLAIPKAKVPLSLSLSLSLSLCFYISFGKDGCLWIVGILSGFRFWNLGVFTVWGLNLWKTEKKKKNFCASEVVGKRVCLVPDKMEENGFQFCFCNVLSCL